MSEFFDPLTGKLKATAPQVSQAWQEGLKGGLDLCPTSRA
jgi:hypothetical protein